MRGLINGLGASTGPVLNAMALCTCVLMIFAMFAVNLFGTRSPAYFRTILGAMYSLFQIATEGSAISREIMEVEPDGLAPDVAIFFVIFITVEVFILLPVVVAVLVENFSIAMHRHREQEENQKLRALRVEHMYTLDPLLESLMSSTSDKDLTSKLLLLFETFDVDDDKIIDFQELYMGLHKMSFNPPIKLTLKEYEHIVGDHFVSKDASSPMIDFQAFLSIAREQLKIYCLRRLGELILSVQEDSQQDAIHLFAFKLLIQGVDKFVVSDGPGFGGQDREKAAPPRALKRAEDSKFFDVATVSRRREYLKKRIVYECWAYKKGEGGPFHSSAYKKRYLIITVDQRLSYYDDPECYYQERSPNGKLSCVGMQCTSIYGNEMIEGKECFPFTIQAKEEGLRTRHCACETYDDREKLLASIVKGSKGPLDDKEIAVISGLSTDAEISGLSTDALFPDAEEIGTPVEQESKASEGILLRALRLLEGKVVEALTRGGSGSGGEGGGLKKELADMTRKADEAEARVGRLERDLKQSIEWSQELHQALTESAQSLQLRSADRDDKVLAALQEILAAVDDLSETVIDQSQRFSSSEKEREAEKKAGMPAALVSGPKDCKRAFQTSIDILSKRVSKNGMLSQRISAYLKEREVERQQTPPGQQLAAGEQARDSLQTGDARAGDYKERDAKRSAVATRSPSITATNPAASAVDWTPRVSTRLRAGSVPTASPRGVRGKSGEMKEQVGQDTAQALAMRTRSQRVFAYEKEREVERQQAPPGQQRQAGSLPRLRARAHGQAPGSLQIGNARAGDDQQRDGFSGKSCEGKVQAGLQGQVKSQTHERSEVLRWRRMHWQGPVVKTPVGDVVMLSDQWVPSRIEADGSGGGVIQTYIPAGPGAGDSRNCLQGNLQQNLQHHPFANPSMTNPLRRRDAPQRHDSLRAFSGSPRDRTAAAAGAPTAEATFSIRGGTPPARTRTELSKE